MAILRGVQWRWFCLKWGFCRTHRTEKQLRRDGGRFCVTCEEEKSDAETVAFAKDKERWGIK